MSYVGNIANGMIACGDKLLTNNISGEIVILGDNTRNKNVRESVIDKILSNNKGEKIESSKWPLTNTFFIILYKIFAFFVRIFNLQNLFICLPDPDYLVLHFSNWTFFNKYKLEYFINWKQKYSYEEAIEKSRKYYTSIPNPLDLPYSWESHPF
uniref:Glycosyltransferase n=1 Tax=Parastrongyloides trichosuri TaxID=131310 RepID=A0A0N5A577_PARTI